MIQAIVEVTAVMIVAVAAVNLGHGVWLGVDLVRQAARRRPGLAARLLPTAFRCRADVLDWLAAWRWVLGAPDPVLMAIRRQGRAVAARHLGLLAGSNAWAMAVGAIVSLAI